ncbi:hypothetical protein GGS26DRAFT_376900 [Hypomontagnella submonticulosa]|nr:hypothetical protein GGS26DRAFT_376900 [Hypomontagnella submonticulosa]
MKTSSRSLVAALLSASQVSAITCRNGLSALSSNGISVCCPGTAKFDVNGAMYCCVGGTDDCTALDRCSRDFDNCDKAVMVKDPDYNQKVFGSDDVSSSSSRFATSTRSSRATTFTDISLGGGDEPSSTAFSGDRSLGGGDLTTSTRTFSDDRSLGPGPDEKPTATPNPGPGISMGPGPDEKPTAGQSPAANPTPAPAPAPTPAEGNNAAPASSSSSTTATSTNGAAMATGMPLLFAAGAGIAAGWYGL